MLQLAPGASHVRQPHASNYSRVRHLLSSVHHVCCAPDSFRLHASAQEDRSEVTTSALLHARLLPDHSCRRNLPAPSSWHVPTDSARRSQCITASARGWSTCWLPAKPRHLSAHSGELCRRRCGSRLGGGGGGCVSTMHLLPPQAQRRPPVLLRLPPSRPGGPLVQCPAATGTTLRHSGGCRSMSQCI